MNIPQLIFDIITVYLVHIPEVKYSSNSHNLEIHIHI